MAALLGSYSPNDVIVAVNGVPLDGFAADTFVNVAYNSDAATMVEGADGSPAIAFKRGMRGGMVTFTCLQTSLANNYLNSLLQAQKFAGTASATLSVTVRNAQGGELHVMPRGVFQKEPEAGFGAEIGSREWTIIGQLNSTFAGNAV